MTQPTVGPDAGMFQRFTTPNGAGADVRSHGPDDPQGPHVAVALITASAGFGVFDGDQDDFAARLRDELLPSGVLEDLLAARLIAAAWRLNEALLARRHGVLLDDSFLDDMEYQLGRAVSSFERARNARRARWGHRAPSEAVCFAAPVVEAPEPEAIEPVSLSDDLGWSRRFDPTASDDPDELPATDDEPTDPSLLWRDRLVLDPDVSDRSPVVRGTWITVSHVVSLVVDGWSWADILRAHPELTEADLRACLTYSVEEEGSGALAD